uniref:Uncharacterized protein n=1 Tax=Wuchereria bancrofti TaxID=6293 RepID=A0A1I8EU54_WUCBA
MSRKIPIHWMTLHFLMLLLRQSISSKIMEHHKKCYIWTRKLSTAIGNRSEKKNGNPCDIFDTVDDIPETPKSVEIMDLTTEEDFTKQIISSSHSTTTAATIENLLQCTLDN